MKGLLKIFLPLLALLGSAPKVYAHCPLCAGAVVAGAAGAKYLGLDLTIVGLFAGAAGISIGLWMNRLVKKKYFKGQQAAMVLGSFVLTIVPTMPFVPDEIYMPLLGNVYFVNRLLLGSIIGGAVTLLAFSLSNKIKAARGKVLFPFQAIVITLLGLAIAAIPLYFAFK